MHIAVMLLSMPFIGNLITNPPITESQAWGLLGLLITGALFYIASR